MIIALLGFSRAVLEEVNQSSVGSL